MKLLTERPALGDKPGDVFIGRRCKRNGHARDRGLEGGLVEGGANGGANGGAFSTALTSPIALILL
jgi:hypothetical protein